jgi:hypothetical protein
MLSSLFISKKSTTQEQNIIYQLNNEKFKAHILHDFISNFIDNNANDAKITKVKKILKENKVFFGGKYINDIINKRKDTTIELYISFEYIVDFLLQISDCNKNYDDNNLLQQLTISLNINSRYNNCTPKSVYEINYINITTNRNIIIYVVNDDNIIDKILDTEITKNKLWYDYENNIIAASKDFEVLQPSHILLQSDENFKQMNNTNDYLFEDIIIEIIKYIPSYISLSDISDEILDSSITFESIYVNFIYNYPAIWFLFLINMKNYQTYNVLSYVYYNIIMKQTKPNTVIDLNNIITRIYINSLLNKYEISLILEINTIKFNINKPIKFSQEEETNIKKLLLFYYKYKISIFPYKYKFQKFIIDYNLIDYISPLISIKTRNLLTLDEEIENFYKEDENKCEFHDIINGIMDIQKEDLKTYLKNKENILIFGRDTQNGFLISKNDLDKIVLESYEKTWLVNCNELTNNNSKLLLSVYIKITISSGDYYISYGNMFSLFNSDAQIFYIVDTNNSLNNVFNFKHFNNKMTIEEIKIIKEKFCINIMPYKISQFKQLSTKAIHIVQEDYDPFSKITDKSISLSQICNKKLSIAEDRKSSFKSSKRAKKK